MGVIPKQVVLIEGAPGVGKTTFSWEFYKKWGKGEILQDNSLLLLLPLQDNNLKEAKSLSDLFYNSSSKQWSKRSPVTRAREWPSGWRHGTN